jgi:hypothetical protein
MKVPSGQTEDRWSIGRDVVVFQFKLLADGFRDMLLIPASLVAGLVGLIFYRDRPEYPFHTVLGLGKRSEHWINLFGSLPRKQQLEASMSVSRAGNLDLVVDRLEDMLLEQYEKGGITAGAKDSIDRSINALHRRIDKAGSREDEPGSHEDGEQDQ